MVSAAAEGVDLYLGTVKTQHSCLLCPGVKTFNPHVTHPQVVEQTIYGGREKI